MSSPLYSDTPATELLELYGYEPYNGGTVQSRWHELITPYVKESSAELGHLRQVMLTIHQECYPDKARAIDG